jgi:hypothetical protein
MSKSPIPFTVGENIVNDSPDVKNPPTQIVMAHEPSPVKSLPVPDSVVESGSE